jgi:hypothetical protein
VSPTANIGVHSRKAMLGAFGGNSLSTSTGSRLAYLTQPGNFIGT